MSGRHDRRARLTWQVGRYWISAPALLVPPMALFWFLRTFAVFDRTVASNAGHFIIVTTVAALALALAVAVAVAARRVPDARTFFLAMGFLAMAAIFLAHALGTAPLPAGAPMGHAAVHILPAVAPFDGASAYEAAPAPAGLVAATVAPGGTDEAARARGLAVGFSGRLSLLVSAVCFALAALDIRPRLADLIVRRWTALAAGLAASFLAYMAVAVLSPTALTWIPMTSERLNWTVAGIAWCCLAFAGWRFFQAYRLAALPLAGAMALGMALLAEAQLFMLLGPLWRLSWWEYHVVMLAGFLLPVAALLRQYRAAGDLGAIVEGLFLRRQVSGLRARDPKALLALAAAVSAKDGGTGAHTERVADLSVAIGRRLGLSEGRQELLRWAGHLHDLGKIGVPNRVLRKAGPLTAPEFELMKEHTTRGWRVALRSGALAQAAWLIRAHHERIDGSGYPDGLAGAAIPLEARIIAVADTWDALVSDRPYRSAMPYDDAAEVLAAEAGLRLDHACVMALFTELEERAWAAEGALTAA